MNSTTNLNLDNFTNDQEFDFLNALNKNDSSFYENDVDSPDDSPFSNILLNCKYLDENQFVTRYNNLKDFSFVTFNIQSLQAKFTEFENTILNLQANKTQESYRSQIQAVGPQLR